MKIILQQKSYSFVDIITNYQRLLETSQKILVNVPINVEKIIYAKITALPESPHLRVIYPEVITLSLSRDFRIVDYDKSVDISKLTWKESFLKIEFIGSVKDTKAVFTVTVRGSGKDRTDYGDIEIYAYGNDFDGFDELFKRVRLDPEPISTLREVKYFSIGPLDSCLYDLNKIIVFSTNDVRSFLSIIMKFLRKVSSKNPVVVEKVKGTLISFPNFNILLKKIYNKYSKERFIEAVHKSFVEKGYHVIPGSLTVYGDKPLFEGYLNFLEKVIIPNLSDFPT
jgi:hypothetical protein